jgi:hypothetical protein
LTRFEFLVSDHKFSGRKKLNVRPPFNARPPGAEAPGYSCVVPKGTYNVLLKEEISYFFNIQI